MWLIGKLFDQFGTKKQKKVYTLIKPEEQKQIHKKTPKLRLPEGYISFEESNSRFIPHIEAIKKSYPEGENIVTKIK